tara:strand:- start:46 stop:321 length:276 start_codon:yes stop_codon:yes gene_type:complete
MAQTVTEVLTAATDSVTLINEINDNGVEDMDQADINDMVQRNVDHLEIILAYEPDSENESDETPDIVGDDSDKSSYTDAIDTGNAYITSNG